MKAEINYDMLLLMKYATQRLTSQCVISLSSVGALTSLCKVEHRVFLVSFLWLHYCAFFVRFFKCSDYLLLTKFPDSNIFFLVSRLIIWIFFCLIDQLYNVL